MQQNSAVGSPPSDVTAVQLVSECPGLHPVMPLATGSTIPAVEETVVVRMSVEDTLTATL